jgi:hypothetical protein
MSSVFTGFSFAFDIVACQEKQNLWEWTRNRFKVQSRIYFFIYFYHRLFHSENPAISHNSTACIRGDIGKKSSIENQVVVPEVVNLVHSIQCLLQNININININISTSTSTSMRLVLIGGGLANSLVIETLTKDEVQRRRRGRGRRTGDDDDDDDEVELIVISKSTRVYYPPMVPGAVAGLYEEKDTFFDLKVFASRRGWRFIHGRFVFLFFFLLFLFLFSFLKVKSNINNNNNNNNNNYHQQGSLG